MKSILFVITLMIGWIIFSTAPRAAAPPSDPQAAEFFEKQVRPVLVEHCLSCHGPRKQRGGLRLDSRDALRKGGTNGPVLVPGNPDQSLLVRALRYNDKVKMPPKGKLADAEVNALTAWVRRGAPWPDEAAVKTSSGTEVRTRHWSFQAVRQPALPAVKNSGWIRTPVDAFILARLEEQGLAPSPPADKRTLLRRVTFDLIGLPPTPKEIEAFLADSTPDAFATVVDRLLNSPHYGERWGRHWLDVVRFADGARAGSGADFDGEIWRYRDWVTEAFNRDLPYSEFLTSQLAGDLLEPSAVAGGDPLVATGMLAIAHFNPDIQDLMLKNADYVDDQVDVVGRVCLGLTLSCARCHDHKFDPISTEDYYALAGIFFNTRILESLVGDKTKRLRAPLRVPKGTKEVVVVVQEGGHPGGRFEKFCDAPVYIRGNPHKTGKVVPRGFPRVLAGVKPHPIIRGSGRLELARWLTEPDHPLTARVMVNRLWQHHFGAGIVRTPNNFGELGERPTHPELLDYLAVRFVQSGWSVKAMHRLMLLSAVYQQSSQASPEAVRQDPDNRLVGRMNRQRLEAEAFRDSLLAVAGRLDLTRGGSGFTDLAVPRRTCYLRTVRADNSSESDFGHLFDRPDPSLICDQRAVSTVVQQALFLLNDPFVIAQAKALASRLAREASGEDSEAKIRRLYLLCLGRPPLPAEIKAAGQFLAEASSAKPEGPGKATDQVAFDPWSRYCQLLLCSNEFMYVD